MEEEILNDLTEIISRLKDEIEEKEKVHEREFKELKEELENVEIQIQKLKETSVSRGEIEKFRKKMAKLGAVLDQIGVGEL